jgi:3'(2'), 5'-bisphosphate nucleotidase
MLQSWLNTAVTAAAHAGHKIMEVYGSDDFGVEIKSDNSPLTKADKEANDIIQQALSATDIPVLSEEGKHIPYNQRKNWEHLWVVDPLDGTKEFIKRNGEFTVNIALVENHKPILGVIYVPVTRVVYFGAMGLGAYKGEIPMVDLKQLSSIDVFNFLRDYQKLPLAKTDSVFRVVGSRSHMSEETTSYINAITKNQKKVEVISAGSALKLCLVAEGTANVYPRFAPTMEWDIAAGHAIINEAGKKVLMHNSDKELIYNRENNVNGWFVAS